MKISKKPSSHKKREPTLRMKKVVKNMVEKGGSLRKNIKDAGYSQKIADNPQQLLKSKSFQQLLDDVMPEYEVANLHKYLLKKKDLTYKTFPIKMSDFMIKSLFQKAGVEIIKIYKDEKINKKVYFLVRDEDVLQKAIDMYYKVKGSYAPQKFSLEDPYENMTDEELIEKSKELEALIEKKK